MHSAVLSPRLLLVPLALFAALSMNGAAAQVVLVAAANSPISSLPAVAVADIFLGRGARLADGRRIEPVDAAFASPEYKQFYRDYLGRTPPQMRAYWSKLVFTGKGRPPREAGSVEALRTLVASHTNFLGYLPKTALDGSVKIVALTSGPAR